MTPSGTKQLIGNSPAFRRVLDIISVIARSDVSVQISGETGTGKEMCARSIHSIGSRAERPFIPVNCGGFPTELLENELFGHIRGAFTGAHSSSEGLINATNNGTLFLDEIDCLHLHAQVKILRLLQEKEYRQLGSTEVKYADVRIIVATNVDLRESVAKGAFRQDLFYRLNVVPIVLPALRERKDDIPLLARYFLKLSAEKLNVGVSDFSHDSLAMLCRYDWPGNVRELENIITRAVIFAKDTQIQVEDLALPSPEPNPMSESFRAKKARAISEFERCYLHEVLLASGGNITHAARAAQKNRRAFWELMRKYKIDIEKYRPPLSACSDKSSHW
jgi:two-component system, NtrC family, response regulator GlrR